MLIWFNLSEYLKTRGSQYYQDCRLFPWCLNNKYPAWLDLIWLITLLNRNSLNQTLPNMYTDPAYTLIWPKTTLLLLDTLPYWQIWAKIWAKFRKLARHCMASIRPSSAQHWPGTIWARSYYNTNTDGPYHPPLLKTLHDPLNKLSHHFSLDTFACFTVLVIDKCVVALIRLY